MEFNVFQGNGRLRHALAPLLRITDVATAHCDSQGISLQVSDPLHTLVGVLRFHSLFFDSFLATVRGMAGLQISDLHDNILEAYMDDEDNMNARSDCHSNNILFTFGYSGTNEIRTMAAEFIAIPHDYVNFDYSSFEYKVIVGLTSEDFGLIFGTLGNTGPVNVSIEASQMRFYTPTEEIILERGEYYILRAIEEYQEINFVLNTCTINPMVEASELCTTVWLLHSGVNSPPTPTLIHFPIEPMAHLNLFLI